MKMGCLRFDVILVFSLSLSFFLFSNTVSAQQLRQNYYANICPNVESIVRSTVQKKFQQTFVTVPATLRLFFHDCFVQGCDASVVVASTPNNKAEKDHPDNLSLAGDGFDTVIKAKAAVDAVPSCRNKVSCADILAMATRDVVALSGGPSYAVELGRLDGLSSTAASVNGKLPQPTFNLNQLNSLFAANGLSQTDMIALSAAHTLGFSHCGKFANRIYNFSRQNPVDPTLNKAYATQLQQMCPKNVDPRIAINMDPKTPQTFDNAYYKNLQQGMGLFTSDQILFTDARSRPTVNAWASNSPAFQQAFVAAMTKLGRVGVKTGRNGNIRTDCGVLN
ncbi:Peroxidase 73 precursor, putative [Ricinus communis]|uniref:Peroxidase n=1 Tax=Ricinus communis TaxID=3988 RepID=B9SGY3_RICCO|nr:Peroxidase 73 precursor, putative [Ricinus communis]|eukprot:XP_002525252.1 peroxidase 73 [Ricinus communis]